MGRKGILFGMIILGVILGPGLTHSGQGAPISTKAEVPNYVGLGEFENPSQGVNLMIPRQRTPFPPGPIIKNAYAIDRGIYGTILKIYIEAEDPAGEMAKIATTVDQVGYGHYPTDFIILGPEHRKSFKGYIQWNTFSSHTSSMHQFVRQYVTVAVIDKNQKSSNEFVFPFTFETGVALAPPPPAPFDQGDLPRLGTLSIDLFDPYQKDSGGIGHVR